MYVRIIDGYPQFFENQIDGTIAITQEQFSQLNDGRRYNDDLTPIPEPEPYIPTLEEQLNYIRHERNALLAQTDKFMLLDNFARLSSSEQDKLLKYRQDLRDFPANWLADNTLNFPTIPSFIK